MREIAQNRKPKVDFFTSSRIMARITYQINAGKMHEENTIHPDHKSSMRKLIYYLIKQNNMTFFLCSTISCSSRIEES